MAKKKKKGRSNPGTMTVTNPKGKKNRKHQKKTAKKRRRNPAGKKGFLSKWFAGIGNDAKLAIPNLGGRYIGETMSVVGAQYLGDKLGGFAGLGGQVLTHMALTQFAPNKAAWNQVRIGLLSEAIHELALGQLGVDVPGMLLDLMPGQEAPAPAPAAEEGAGRLGVLQNVKTTISNRMATAPDYSF